MTTNPDPRALRTRRLLVDSYRQLVDDADGREPSVAQIVRHANVTRSAFYAHFGGTAELAAEVLTELFDLVASSDTLVRQSDMPDSAERATRHSLAEVVSFVADNRALYLAYLGERAQSAGIVEDAFAEHVLQALHEVDADVPDPEVFARFAAAGALGVIAWWIRDGGGRTASDLVRGLLAVYPRELR